MSRKFRITSGQGFAFKMLLAFIVVIVIVLTAFTLFAVIREGQKEKESLQEQGEMLAGILARNSLIGVYSENKQILRDMTESIAGLKNVAAVMIYNAGLDLLYAEKIHPSDFDDLSVSRTLVPALDADQSLRTRESTNDFEFIMPVILPFPANKDERLYFGESKTERAAKVIGYVRIILSKDTYRQRIYTILRENAVVMLIFIVSSTVIVFFSVRKITRPLERLTGNVKALEKGLHVDPVPVDSKDEVGNLATAFNAMVAVREQTEKSLRESEERYRKLVDLSPDGIYVLQEGAIVFTNSAGADLLGSADSSQVLGRNMYDFVDAEDRGILQTISSHVEERKKSSAYFQIRYGRPDGTLVEAEVAAAPLVFGSRPAVLVIARDVTERKGMEEKIRNYQRELYAAATEMSTLESRVEERERYLIAADLHDYVGQNLVVLQLKLGLLRRAILDPTVLDHIDEIRDIIGKTIQYTRSLTAELNPPILVEIGFKPAVESLAEAFKKTHGLTITVKDDGRPVQIGNEYRYLLFRCVREILMNVVKHAHAENVEVAMSRSGDRMYITVADDGSGFDLSTIDRKKSGFGLFSIRERMKRLGGYCEINSKPGAGTMVILAMPVDDPKKGGA
jgi:PAS domain S-box-containing protein